MAGRADDRPDRGDDPGCERWWYEPKFDSFRYLAFRPETGRVQLQSRRQRSLAAFAEIVELAATRLCHGLH